jgi:putative transposon-encoded protein
MGCTGLTDITIPNSVTSIGNSAFMDCAGLTGITLPNSVTSIGNNAFKGCTRLTDITIPSSVTSIGNSAFMGCAGLTGITIPNSVISIGGWAFRGCTGLTDITIPNSVTSIGGFVFSGCTGLKRITIPSSVTSIGERAFVGCDQLEVVVINSDSDSDFERIKELLPENIQSKVLPFKELQEKKGYKLSKLNEALTYKKAIPFEAKLLSYAGGFFTKTSVPTQTISQFMGVGSEYAEQLVKRLNVIPLTLETNEYIAEIDNVIASFVRPSEMDVQPGAESREAEAPSCSAVRQSL